MDLDLEPLTRADAPAIWELMRRRELHWELPIVTTLEEIDREFDDPHLVPELDYRGVRSGGRLVAAGAVMHSPSGVRLEKTFIRGAVDPEFRGIGIGRRLLAWQIERSTDLLRLCDPALPRYIRAYEWDFMDDAHHLYRRFGLRPVRWFEEMLRPLDPLPPIAPPENVSLVPWESVDRYELLDLANEAFADHWGSTPRVASTWDYELESDVVRPDLSFVAVADGRPVGYSLNAHYAGDEEVTGRRDGWIESLGVARQWRRRGVARALIARSLEAFAEAGFTHAMLGVDSDNPSGAAGLYTRLGFRTEYRTVASEREVPVSAAESVAVG